jgi:hypothetical protein
MDAAAVRQSLADRLKSNHYDLERLCAVAFGEGHVDLATELHEAGNLVDQAIGVLTHSG